MALIDERSLEGLRAVVSRATSPVSPRDHIALFFFGDGPPRKDADTP